MERVKCFFQPLDPSSRVRYTKPIKKSNISMSNIYEIVMCDWI